MSDNKAQADLTDFLSKNTRVNHLTSMKALKQVDTKSPQLYFVGAPDCPYTQLGASSLDVACSETKKGDPQCNLIDATTSTGQKIIKKLGFENLEGYPTLFVKDGEETIKVTGMRNAPQMREIIQKSKSVLAKQKVGSRPKSVFPL